MRELVSKLVAGGLSAAVILLWWPQFFPADNATTWLIRGVLWTLSFELLLHALMPIEGALWETRAGRRVRSGASRAGDRIGSPRRSVRGRAAVACAALSVPVALLALAPAQPAGSSATASVRHVTEVKRIVRVERRQVRVAKIVPVAAATPQATPVPDPALATERVRTRKPAAKPSTGTRRQAGQTTPAPSKGGASSGAQTTTGTSQNTAAVPEQPAEAPRVVRRDAAA